MRKFRKFLARLGLYGILFVLILFVLGIVSGFRAMKYWINDDEVIPNEWTLEMGSKGEVDYISNFCGKNNFLNLNGLMKKVMGQQEMNEVIRLNNGYLAKTYDYISDEELRLGAMSLGNLNRYLNSTGALFLVAAAPDTVSKYDPQLPAGMVDYVNDNLDRMIALTREQGVEVLDFREEIHNDGIDQYTLMYRTDHHWNTRAGFYAYGKLADWIEEKTGVKVDEEIRNLDNYSITNYEEWHLGSRGQRTGSLYAGIDDFELILPKFDTLLSNGDSTGTFEDLLISYTALEEKDLSFRYTYDVTMEAVWGNYVNLLADNDLKVLAIGDSFTRAVWQYMDISYKENRFVHYQNLGVLNEEYMAEYDPDVVILLYYPENLLNQSSLDFFVPYVE